MTDHVNGHALPGLATPLPDQPNGVLMMLNTPAGNILTFHTDGRVVPGPAYTATDQDSLRFLELLAMTYLGWLPQVVIGWLKLQRGTPVTRAYLRGVLPGLNPEVCDRVVAGLCEELAQGVLEDGQRAAREREIQGQLARAAAAERQVELDPEPPSPPEVVN